MKRNNWKIVSVVLGVLLVAIVAFAAVEYVETFTCGDITVYDDATITDDASVGGDIAVTGDTSTATLTMTGTSDTWDPASLNDAAQESKDFTVVGAALGDAAIAGAGVDVTDLIVSAVVTAADTVTVTLANETGGAVDLASSTWYVYVILDD